MGRKERIITNKRAREESVEDLYSILADYFCEQKNRDLSEEDEECLRRVAEDIRGNVVTWSKVQGAIDDGDWEPWHGSRGLFGPM